MSLSPSLPARPGRKSPPSRPAPSPKNKLKGNPIDFSKDPAVMISAMAAHEELQRLKEMHHGATKRRR
ncbi:hypothetical protein TrRE_jg8173, partial [Triparma retinervis]